jgi:hypothetical protein
MEKLHMGLRQILLDCSAEGGFDRTETASCVQEIENVFKSPVEKSEGKKQLEKNRFR